MKFLILFIIFFGQLFLASWSFLFHVKHVLDNFVDNELYFRMRHLFNTTRKDCVWRYYSKHSGLCSQDVKITLHSNGYEEVVSGVYNGCRIVEKIRQLLY